MLARITRRMTGSTMLGCVAGLLLALDGLELVLSRTAILDIFVMFWVLAAFGLLVIDRDRTMARLADAAAAGPHDLIAGPKLGIRWLRVAAGVCLGRAVAASGTACGSCSPSPAWRSPGIWAPGGQPASATGWPAACAATP